MRAYAVFIVLLFGLQAGMGFISATTPETITVDGDVSEWSVDTEMATDSNGVSLHVTWDADNFYVAWAGTDWASTTDGADLFVYFNKRTVFVSRRILPHQTEPGYKQRVLPSRPVQSKHHDSRNLTPVMHGTQQNWILV